MLGSSHAFYGFILGEIIFIKFIKNSGEAKRYNRRMVWILGILGGWSLDMDSISGFFYSLFSQKESLSLLLYHRHFSHSLGFLFVILFILLFLTIYVVKYYPLERKEKVINSHPLRQEHMEKNWFNFTRFIIIVIGFA